jgi:hypothetical protein
MVARRTDLEEAAHSIEHALWQIVNNRACDKVLIRDNDWGQLWAVVGSDAFKGKNIALRQDHVWDYLRKHVSPEQLVHLTRVYEFDHDEFDARVSRSFFPGGVTEILDLGSDNHGITN